jgi:tripartite-type tricarboxylate transporter receptor subunit TctC
MAGDSLNDMASGNIDFGCHDPVFALSQQREGRLRILAVAANDRLKAAPDLPTMSEAGYKMDLVGWFAAMVPSATPRPIVDKINAWFSQIHADPETKKFLNNFGGDPWVSTPDEGQARLVKDIKDWEEYVRVAKLKPQG